MTLNLPIPYLRLLEGEPCDEWWAIAKSVNLMMLAFFFRILINKSVSSLDAHGVSVPGPILSSKTYVSVSSVVLLVKMFEVSAFALKRSNTDITGE